MSQPLSGPLQVGICVLPDHDLNGVHFLYKAATPGVQAGDNTTTILGARAEPQPDLSLRILREYGGQARENENRHLEGPPELISEVADSSEAIGLGAKRIRLSASGGV